jgi:hypothetical protein
VRVPGRPRPEHLRRSDVSSVWQQDRWSNGGAHGLVAGYSFDGGTSWGETTLPFDACANGLGYQRASDPWVSFGPDGTAYTVSISFNDKDNNNAVAAATSTDGGKTWQRLSVLIADNAPNFQFFNDKESVTADPTKAGTAYVVWDRLESPTANPDAELHAAAFSGPAMLSKTTDGGQTWSSPQVIVNTPSVQQTIGNQIVVDPRTGALYDFFDLIAPPFNVTAFKVAFVKSTDGGNTWTKPKVISNLRTVFVSDPNTGEAVRTGDIIPEPAIDPATGQLYVVWQDSRFNGGHFDEVAISTSTNGGATWSAPKQVNTNTPANRPAFTPAVAVNSAGAVGVTYYDFSLNGGPGEVFELPGTAPPAASTSWQDWLGRPVPLGLPAANAGAAPAMTSIPARTPAVIAARMMSLLWLPADERTPTTNDHEWRPAPVHDRPDLHPSGGHVGRAVLRRPVGRARAVGVLLKLRCLPVVFAGPGIVGPVGEGPVDLVIGVPGGRSRTVCRSSRRAAVLVDLRLAAVVADDRPVLRAAAVRLLRISESSARSFAA